MMTYHLIDEFVSIYSKPNLDELHLADAGAQVTIGDLHGNAIKFLFTLVKHGFITDMSEEKYDELVSLYCKNIDELSKDDLTRYNNIITSLHINNVALLRLLGDELCDRGVNDYFTLVIIKKLQEQKVNLEIILSNHSVEFIDAYETKLKFFPTVLENHFSTSMINMQILIARKLITREEVLGIVKKAYKPCLIAVSYSLSEDNKEITLFSHAPIDIRAISALSKKLGVNFEDYSAIALAKTIDAINQVYHTHVMNNTVHTLFDRTVMETGYQALSFSPLFNPIEYITWNRDLTHLNQPETHKGYKIFYAHGHDSQVSENKNVFNLDSKLGKNMELYLGKYTALYSHDKQLAHVNKPFLNPLSSNDNNEMMTSMVKPII